MSSLIRIIISVLIIFSPVIITGRFFIDSSTFGTFLSVEFVVRMFALILGLFLIHNEFRNK